jgi:hypothetical protein
LSLSVFASFCRLFCPCRFLDFVLSFIVFIYFCLSFYYALSFFLYCFSFFFISVFLCSCRYVFGFSMT